MTRSTDDSLGPPMTTRRRSSEEKAKVAAASAVDKYQEWMGAARNQMQTRSGQAGRVKSQSIAAATTRSKSARNRRDGIVARASVPPVGVPPSAAAPVAVSTEKSGSGFLSSLPFGRWAKSSNTTGHTAPPPSQVPSGGIAVPSSNASSSMPHFMDRFLYLVIHYCSQIAAVLECGQQFFTKTTPCQF